MPNHPILPFWDEVDGVWVADVPDVRFCSAHGETAEAALRNVTEALADFLADAAERGIALLPPPERPVLAQAS